MRHKPVSHKELDEALDSVRHKLRLVKVLAVKAELTEQEKDRRDLSQETVAGIFGVDSHELRTWIERYRAEGIKGLGE